jgi:predicted transcriptional regulator of viral defense system
MPADIPAPPELPVVYRTSELTPARLAELKSTGDLRRVRRGAYVQIAARDPRWRRRETMMLARCVAIARTASASYAFSHVSAALIHGCPIWTPEHAAHLTQTVTPSVRPGTDVRRHVSRVPADEVTRVRGLPVTTLERTVLDCIRNLHPRDGLVIADAAMRILIRPDRRHREAYAERIDELRNRLLARLERPDMARGRRRARAVLRAADPYAESAAESVLRWIAVSRGLPHPRTQYRIETHEGLFYSDMAWVFRRAYGDGSPGPALVLHAEFDGQGKYGADAPRAIAAVRAEKVREDAIREVSGPMVRFMRPALDDPEAVFARLTKHVTRQYLLTLQANPDLHG